MPILERLTLYLLHLTVPILFANTVCANPLDLGTHGSVPSCASDTAGGNADSLNIESCRIVWADEKLGFSASEIETNYLRLHNETFVVSILNFKSALNSFIVANPPILTIDNFLDANFRHLVDYGFAFAPAPAPESSKPSESATIRIAWDDATLHISPTGFVQALIDNDTGKNHIARPYRFIRLETDEGIALPRRAIQTDDMVLFEFSNGDKANFRVTPGIGHSGFELVDYTGNLSNINRIRMGALSLRGEPDAKGEILNLRYLSSFVVGVMATEPNVRAYQLTSPRGDKAGVSHAFSPETSLVKEGNRAALFSAHSKRDDNSGHAVVHKRFDRVKNLSGMTHYRLWVHGDKSCPEPNNPEVCTILKIQLKDRYGRLLDNVLKIDFEGWKQIELEIEPRLPIDKFDLSQVVQLSFYYNQIKANGRPKVVIDSVRAVLNSNRPHLVLEDFEDEESALWDELVLAVESYEKFGLLPLSFAIVGTKQTKLDSALENIEKTSHLPHIMLDGQWGKQSDRAKSSYLLVHKLSLNEVDEVIASAQRGGFGTILIGTDWSKSYGHHQVDPTYFPDTDNDSDGLENLVVAANKVREAGLRIGLHVLAAAIDTNDPYITANPKGGPDARIYTGESIQLNKRISANESFIPTARPPLAFPTEDGGYNGFGTYILIDNEIIQYTTTSLNKPYGFRLSKADSSNNERVNSRGALGTKADAHDSGKSIRHLVRPYGYFLHDLNTNLSQDVANSFCRVANAIDADMIYLDGSERLQGGSDEHWFYNGRLVKLYFDCLDDKNTLLQASTYSHYSWHYLSRQTSGDLINPRGLKNYIDSVIANRYSEFKNERMPIDSGWYFAISPLITSDQIEYLLKYTIAYDSSVSVSTYPNWPRTHPELGSIFDLIRRYDQIRFDDQISASSLELMKEPGREYRLTTDPVQLNRVKYFDWQEVDFSKNQTHTLTIDSIEDDICEPGFEIRIRGKRTPGSAYRDDYQLILEDFSTENDINDFVLSHSPDIETSRIDRIGSCPEKGSCMRLSSKNGDSDNPKNHAIAQRKFDPPLDISGHQAIGLWVYGDGVGGLIKLQLREGPWTPTVPYADYRINNNFIGWRYFQLIKPSASRGKLTHVQFLALYLNNIPKNREVKVNVDDIRALAIPDPPALRNPSFRAGDQAVSITADLQPGERLKYFPREAAKLIRARPEAIESLATNGHIAAIEKPVEAKLSVEFGQAQTEIRTLLSCSEHLNISK